MRINKFMAECGVASRRACDEMILEGRVKVNGKKSIRRDWKSMSLMMPSP